jgi:hypothetical protein
MPPHAAHVTSTKAQNILTLKNDAPGGWLDETKDAAADSSLAGAGFADEAERLAAPDPETDSIDGFDLRHDPRKDAAFYGEVLFQIADDEQLVAGAEAKGWGSAHDGSDSHG